MKMMRYVSLGGQVVEELGHHLERLAARRRQPGGVLLDLLDLLELVVAPGIVGVGGADVVGDDLARRRCRASAS